MTQFDRLIPITLPVLCLVLAAGCGGSGTEAPATPAPGGSGGSAAAPLTDGVYDPSKDPLVNPASMYAVAPTDSSLIAEDDVLYRTLDGNPANLNPIFMSSTFEFYLSDVLFEFPFLFDKEMAWQVNDRIVDSFVESDDHLTYTVKLKPGLTWHDGHPYTAHDVEFSYRAIVDDRVPCPAVKTGTLELQDVKALDDLTFVITHKEALPTNVWNALFPVIPKHLYDKDQANNPDLKTGDYYNELNRNVVGNGPYKVVKWIENDRIEVERWDDFPGPRPHYQRMVFRIIPDKNILLLSFNKGDTDEFRMEAKQFATQTLPGSDFAKVGHKVLKPQWAHVYIGWNMNGSNPFFNDVKVRRAMTMACDVGRMVRDLAYNLYQPSHGPFHPDSWMFNPAVKRLPYDLAQASALLDEAGWKIDEERGGWRHKVIGGQPVKFEFTLAIPQSAQISIDTAAIYQEDLKSIGVDMKTHILEWATFQQTTRKHEAQAWIAAWGTGTDPYTLKNIFHSEQYDPDGTFGRNYGGYKNPQVDALFERAEKEFDQSKRAADYQEIHRHLYEDQAYTFLWYRGTFWGLHNRIGGVTTSPRGIFNFDPAERIWWTPAGRSKVALAQP